MASRTSGAEDRARGGWLLSYGDMVTLLITFFIMMITVQAGQIQKVHAWVNSRLDEAALEADSVMQNSGITEITVARDSRGVRFTLGDPRLFRTASAQPRSDMLYQLDAVARAIRNLNIFHLKETRHVGFLNEMEAEGLKWDVEIRIEGHTDNVPLTRNALYRDNWELSAARAQTIMIQLQQRTGLPASDFAIAGFGEFQPIGDNASVDGRERNRRVEIYVDGAMVQAQD